MEVSRESASGFKTLPSGESSLKLSFTRSANGQYLVNEVENLLKMSTFSIDFESPFLKEIKNIFGPSTQASTSWIHMKRNLWKHARALPYLQSFFHQSESFATFLKGFGALAFVPASEIFDYYEALMEQLLSKVVAELDESEQEDPDKREEVEAIKKSINDFISYFEGTYLGIKTRTGYTEPRYPPKFWNQHQNIMDG